MEGGPFFNKIMWINQTVVMGILGFFGYSFIVNGIHQAKDSFETLIIP